MGEIKCFPSYKLIIGVLTTVCYKKNEILEVLSGELGEIDYVSSFIDFNYTDYYNREMGDNIKRFFVSFKNLIDPSSLADIKILTNKLEKQFTENNQSGVESRRVNFDPGILNLSRLILASTKDNAHRVPLDKGIYGEITLLFQKKGIQALPWSYIDYQSREYTEIFFEIREIFRSDLKKIEDQI
ncbi:MAG: DUF4416 family protein [Spirochaetaceae bacterium]|nr:DUF4416 family protein [Spirochaetaceae bacterium]